jgi:hypothetical protein
MNDSKLKLLDLLILCKLLIIVMTKTNISFIQSRKKVCDEKNGTREFDCPFINEKAKKEQQMAFGNYLGLIRCCFLFCPFFCCSLM